MEKCTLLLKKILGEGIYLKLLWITFRNLMKKNKGLKVKEFIEAIHFNHQALLFIALQKAEGIDKNDIEKSLQWKKEKVSRYILTDNVFEFFNIYKDFIDEIVIFINRK